MPKNSDNRRGAVSRVIDQRSTFRFAPQTRPQARPSDTFNPNIGQRAVRRARDLEGLIGLTTNGVRAGVGVLDDRDARAAEQQARATAADPSLEKPEGTPGFFNDVQARQDAWDDVSAERDAVQYKADLAQLENANAYLEDGEFNAKFAEITNEFLAGKSERYLSVFAPEAAKHEAAMRTVRRAKIQKQVITEAKDAASTVFRDSVSGAFATVLGKTGEFETDLKLQQELSESEPSDAVVANVAAALKKGAATIVAQGGSKAEASSNMIQSIGLLAVRTKQPWLLDALDVPNKDDNGLKLSDLPQFRAVIDTYRAQAVVARDRLEDDLEREDEEATRDAINAATGEFNNDLLDLKRGMSRFLDEGHSPTEVASQFSKDIEGLEKRLDTFRHMYEGDVNFAFVERFQDNLNSLFSRTTGQDTTGDQEVLDKSLYLLRTKGPGDPDFDAWFDLNRHMDEDYGRISEKVRKFFSNTLGDIAATKAGNASEQQKAHIASLKAAAGWFKNRMGGASGANDGVPGFPGLDLGDGAKTPEQISAGIMHNRVLELVSLGEVSPDMHAALETEYQQILEPLKQEQAAAEIQDNLVKSGAEQAVLEKVDQFHKSPLHAQLRRSKQYSDFTPQEQSQYIRSIVNLPVTPATQIQILKNLDLPYEEKRLMEVEYQKQLAIKKQQDALREQQALEGDETLSALSAALIDDFAEFLYNETANPMFGTNGGTVGAQAFFGQGGIQPQGINELRPEFDNAPLEALQDILLNPSEAKDKGGAAFLGQGGLNQPEISLEGEGVAEVPNEMKDAFKTLLKAFAKAPEDWEKAGAAFRESAARGRERSVPNEDLIPEALDKAIEVLDKAVPSDLREALKTLRKAVKDAPEDWEKAGTAFRESATRGRARKPSKPDLIKQLTPEALDKAIQDTPGELREALEALREAIKTAPKNWQDASG